MNDVFRSEASNDGIEVVTFDLPGRSANVLNAESMEALDRLAGGWRERKGIRALVLRSAKPGIFVAGADIDQFAAIDTKEAGERLARQGQAIFDKIAHLPFPTVAAIDGACLGGGLELALACRHRVASDSDRTKIGLPEVQLGIVPALGGTQRLPRLVGLRKALDLILTGRRIGATQARRIGLVDEVYPAAIFDEWALRFARDVAGGVPKRRKRRKRIRTWLLERNPLGRAVVFKMARRGLLARTHGLYPAPEAALDCARHAYGADPDEGMQAEARAFGSLAIGPESRSLVRIFHWREEALKGDDAPPDGIERAAVIGAGVMGGGIAWLLSSRGIPVRLLDIDALALRGGLRAARKIHDGRVRRRRESRREAEQAMDRISPTTAMTGFRHAGIVIEAVVEELGIKQKVLAQVEEEAEAIFATNTSAIPLKRIAEEARRPERVVGMHFFNPVHRMPLVEVVRSDRTDPAVLQTAVGLARRIGKVPVVVRDSPGFLVNRILGPYIREACLLLEEGRGIAEVDRALKGFGMPMGPFRLLDEVGIDVTLKVATFLNDALGGDGPPAILDALLKEGRTGRKGGRGFYRYPKGKGRLPFRSRRERPDESVPRLPGVPRRAGGGEPVDIVARLVLPMVSEAAACLQEEVSSKPSEVDLATVLGFGFAPFRGGVLSYADSIGVKEVVSGLRGLAARFGARLDPHPRLVEMAQRGEGFHR